MIISIILPIILFSIFFIIQQTIPSHSKEEIEEFEKHARKSETKKNSGNKILGRTISKYDFQIFGISGGAIGSAYSIKDPVIYNEEIFIIKLAIGVIVLLVIGSFIFVIPKKVEKSNNQKSIKILSIIIKYISCFMMGYWISYGFSKYSNSIEFNNYFSNKPFGIMNK
jgi:hypothetical protein